MERRRLAGAISGDGPEYVIPERHAVQITAKLFRALSRSAVQRGSRLAVAIGSVDDATNWRDAADPRYPRSSLASSTDELETGFFQKDEIPYLNLGPVLKAYSAEHQVLIHGCAENGGRGHWAQAAHFVAADAIYGSLADRKLVP